MENMMNNACMHVCVCTHTVNGLIVVAKQFLHQMEKQNDKIKNVVIEKHTRYR